MTKFDTLYKRTRTGAMQFWQVSVSADPAIIKESGKLGTDKPLTHTEFINEGKQKRNPHEQAEFMALSDWTKKRDEGYKTLQDLGIRNPGSVHVYELDGNGFGTLEAVLEEALPTYNTDASGQMKPMLAPNKAWEANGKTKYPQLAEVKLDGVRAFIVLTPTSTNVLSRSGKIYHKMTHLVELVDRIFPLETRTQTFIMDGELYKHGIPLTKVNEAVRGENEHSSSIQFWIYDLPTSPDVQRTRSLQVAMLTSVINNDLIKYDGSIILNSDAEVREYHDSVIEKGYEGIMLKDPEGTYQPGQRSPFWKKVKMFEDTEFKVIGHNLGQRGVQDLMFVCECDKGTFEAVMNGSVAEKEALYAKLDSLIGKQLTVKHFGYTEYGIPFLPKGKAFREEGE